ncbi:sugar phosphate isomerase/epimerase family protein [Mycobacterium sp. NPDC003449]
MTRAGRTGWPVAYTISSPECREIPDLAYRAELPAALDGLAELGYDGVEIQVRDADAAASAGVIEQVRGRGLGIAALATGPVSGDDGLTFTTLDAGARSRARQRVRGIVDLAVATGVPVTLGRTKGEMNAGSEALQRDWAREAIAELGARAAEGGQEILVEPQSGGFLPTVGAAKEFLGLESRPMAGVGLVFDLWHACNEEQSVAGAATDARELLRHVQLADSHRGPLGEGGYDVAGFLALLRRLEYRGWLTLEHHQGADSRAAAATSLAALRTMGGTR